MIVIQINVSFVIATVYSVVPNILWVDKENRMAECSTTNLFKSNRRLFSL